MISPPKEFNGPIADGPDPLVQEDDSALQQGAGGNDKWLRALARQVVADETVDEFGPDPEWPGSQAPRPSETQGQPP
jgi:hypothetical protein